MDICNQLNLAICNAFKQYNSKTALILKSCLKKFFKYVKTKLKSNNCPSVMQLDENVGNNPEEICNLFAGFFQDIYTKHSKNDRDREYFAFYPELSNTFGVNQIQVLDIFQGLKNLDASKCGILQSFLKCLAKISFSTVLAFQHVTRFWTPPQNMEKLFLSAYFQIRPKIRHT